LMTWGTSGQFSQPFGVVVDRQGQVYVGDTNKGTVQKFSPSGNLVTRWGTGGTGSVFIGTPIGMAVDAQGNLYVVDTAADSSGVVSSTRVVKLSSTGSIIATWK
jgi:DNA-binding beta-propeller fold protein YncE